MITEAALRQGRRSGTFTPPEPNVRSIRLARFDLDTPDASREIQHAARASSGRMARSPRPLPLSSAPQRHRRPITPRRLEAILREHPIDVAFLAMAVSDFAPEPITGKLVSDSPTLTLRCHRLPKVIRSVRDWSPGVYLVGFKLLSNVPEAELIRQGRSLPRPTAPT